MRREPVALLAARFPGTASAASSLEALARESAVVVLSLPHGAAVRGATAAMALHLRAGSLVLDTSTTAPEEARDVAASLAERGVGFLDAPVTGAPQRAADGTLTAMVGGSDGRLLAASTPLLETFATRVLHMGALGNGQLAKALNNCLYNVNYAAMAEMLPFARPAGLPLEAFTAAVSSGTGASFGFSHWAPQVLRREFGGELGFPMKSAFKDRKPLGVPLPQARELCA